MKDPGLRYKSVLLKSQYFHTSSWPSKICKIVVFNLYQKRSGHNENYGVEKYTGDDRLMHVINLFGFNKESAFIYVHKL